MPLAIQTGLFVSLFTALQPPTRQGPTGNIIGDWTPIPGLIDIACTAPPLRDASITATEARELEQILAKEFKHVLLSGWYPQLEQGIATGWRCLVDGNELVMLGAESDSQFTQTRVRVEFVSLGGAA
jgi:hypothetical protein